MRNLMRMSKILTKVAKVIPTQTRSQVIVHLATIRAKVTPRTKGKKSQNVEVPSKYHVRDPTAETLTMYMRGVEVYQAAEGIEFQAPPRVVVAQITEEVTEEVIAGEVGVGRASTDTLTKVVMTSFVSLEDGVDAHILRNTMTIREEEDPHQEEEADRSTETRDLPKARTKGSQHPVTTITQRPHGARAHTRKSRPST